jgi:hypothetical protein
MREICLSGCVSTRSLADFAKLVELFDAQGVSFVSVTQQFNTTTSMGRLTLNVLLSFAQFEREVTSESIRDKIAASKRKGLWVGGPLPLGYEMKTALVGSVSRIPATDIEDIIVKSVNGHLVARHGEPSSSSAHADDGGLIAEQVVRIDVHKDRLIVRFKSAGNEESHSTDGQLLSIPWQKPPSRKSRQILIPLGVPRNEVRPTRIECRARLVGAISRGRRWLDEIVSGSATNIEQIATRQKCSVRQVNMTISLAFLAPDLVKAAVEGRLARGIGVERLRDAPAEWSRQFEALGLNPQ